MDIAEEKARIRKEIRRRRKLLSSKILSEIDSSLPEFIAAIEAESGRIDANGSHVAAYRS